jgi:hypothetical protein
METGIKQDPGMAEPQLTIAQTNAIKNALLGAAADGETDLVQILVHFGANPNSADEDGCTAVSMAAAQGHTATVRALVECGADVNTADVRGSTPLHVAVIHDNDNAAVIWTLVRGGGANTASLDSRGMKARDLARPGSSADKLLEWLEGLQDHKARNADKRAEGFECPVCLEETKGDAFAFVPCGHRVCPGCWAKMRARDMNKCPKCRAPILHGEPQDSWPDRHPLYSRFCVEVPRVETLLPHRH